MVLLGELPNMGELDHGVAYEALLEARGFEATRSGNRLSAQREGFGGLSLTFDAQGRMEALELENARGHE